MTRNELLSYILKLLTQSLALKQQTIAIGLCGPNTRDEAKSDSDIDLIIIVEDKYSFKNDKWLIK